MKNNVLKVTLWDMEVGKLYWDENLKTSIFNYNPEFVNKNVDIAPFTASIHNQYGKGHPFIATPIKKDPTYKGLPPFLADSLPEKWGTTLFNCWAKKNGLNIQELTPVDRLTFIGKRAMGAFEFIPDTYPWKNDQDIDLSKLYHLAARIYEQREEIILLPEEDNLLAGLCEIGTSAGGQHSKAVVAINEITGDIRSGQINLPEEYTYYLMKFAEGTDYPSANIEMAYYEMAKEAGINIMPSKLVQIGGKEHFLTERYDRIDGQKVFTQTLSALMPGVENYEDLFYICDKLNISTKEKEEMFRRTVFNLFSGNTDDHTRNFSFQMSKDGKWSITPAYDLTFTADINNKLYGSFHSLSLAGKDTGFTMDDLKRFADEQGIKNIKQIIDETLSAITNFHQQAIKVGVNSFAANRIEKYLAGMLPVEYGRRMTHYIGASFEPYYSERQFHIQDFRISETEIHDYELRAIIDNKRYRTMIDGESSDGKSIRAGGGNTASMENKKEWIEKFIIPKAEKQRDQFLMSKIKEVSLYDNNEMIRCKTEEGWLLGKKIKPEDMEFDDKYELALKYFKTELLDAELHQSQHKGVSRQ